MYSAVTVYYIISAWLQILAHIYMYTLMHDIILSPYNQIYYVLLTCYSCIFLVITVVDIEPVVLAV